MNTVTEASKLWCPMVRIGVMPASGGPSTINDPTSIAEFSGRCIGAQCAMWRWADAAPEMPEARIWWPKEDEPREEPPRPPDVPASAVWLPLVIEDDDMRDGYWVESQDDLATRRAEVLVDRRGYCGLAGRPEVMP
ncbi:hypothetical protein [Herbaspirillum frisingense]|uniref:hypothetical protein n=1 Tax=Herbaspirillum frisingense TaxID=92645 RepID=UPI0039B0C0CA